MRQLAVVVVGAAGIVLVVAAMLAVQVSRGGFSARAEPSGLEPPSLVWQLVDATHALPRLTRGSRNRCQAERHIRTSTRTVVRTGGNRARARFLETRNAIPMAGRLLWPPTGPDFAVHWS